jgi:hypothetical protein
VIALFLSALLQIASQDAVTTSGDVVLVVERKGGGFVYSCNGRHLDPRRVLSGIEAELRASEGKTSSVFALFDDSVPLDKVFEIGSLLVGKAGLRRVRYFTFSRKTDVMMEFSPSWDRWKLSFDGTLEKKPW